MHWIINQLLLVKWDKKKIFLGASLAISCFWQGFFVMAIHWNSALGYVQEHGNSYDACAERLLLWDRDGV